MNFLQKHSKFNMFHLSTHLKDEQLEIINECVQKGSGGLSLPMGSGKTLISLTLGLQQSKSDEQVLIVVSKSLIHNWQEEIQKWYPNIPYQTLQLNDHIKPDVKFIITTPTTLVKYYKVHDCYNKLVTVARNQERFDRQEYINWGNPEFGAEVKYYKTLTKPLVDLGGFFSRTFGVLVVDEAHNFSNISTSNCRAICSIYAKHRWMLSGTLFAEPKIQNILGFYRMLNSSTFPDNLPSALVRVSNSTYQGVSCELVHRDTNKMYTNPSKVIKNVIKFSLSDTEALVYSSFKDILSETAKDIKRAKLIGDIDNVRLLNARLLSLITTLRLTMITPMIPMSKMYLSVIDTNKSSDIYEIYQANFTKHNLVEYFNDETNLVSTRITKVIDTINSHNNERIVLFSSFRTVIDYIQPIINNWCGRTLYVLKSTHSSKQRGEILKEFRQDPIGILLLTYSLGSDGLNLQCASTVIIMDVWWNEAKSKQAIARVCRFGQTKTVNVYMYVSNTNIEQAMFTKHTQKTSVADELLTGKINTKITSMKMEDIIRILDQPIDN